MVVRPSILDFLKRIDAAQANVVTSIWKNYESNAENVPFFEWVKQKGYERTHYHTSGHADLSGLEMIVSHISPKTIIPIHTGNKAMFPELFDHVVLLDDGEIFEL